LCDVAEMLKSETSSKPPYEKGRGKHEHSGRGNSESIRCFKCQGMSYRAADCRRSDT